MSSASVKASLSAWKFNITSGQREGRRISAGYWLHHRCRFRNEDERIAETRNDRKSRVPSGPDVVRDARLASTSNGIKSEREHAAYNKITGGRERCRLTRLSSHCETRCRPPRTCVFSVAPRLRRPCAVPLRPVYDIYGNDLSARIKSASGGVGHD